MSELSILLCKYNFTGLAACVADHEDSEIQTHLERVTDDAEGVCLAAANKLRLMAEAFELLGQMPDPCKPATQEAALAMAKQGRLDHISTAIRNNNEARKRLHG